MKKLIFLLTIGTSLTFVACNNQQKTDEQIDSINQSAADSLLNEALADTTATDNVAVDSTVVDTLAPKN